MVTLRIVVAAPDAETAVEEALDWGDMAWDPVEDLTHIEVEEVDGPGAEHDDK